MRPSPMIERVFMSWYRRQIAKWLLLERVRAGRRVETADPALRESIDRAAGRRQSVVDRPRRH
ncbi:MAG: hypothetical protein ACNS61_04680 [Candidatus Wenzhouxiangella sp. M2_3B_020]